MAISTIQIVPVRQTGKVASDNVHDCIYPITNDFQMRLGRVSLANPRAAGSAISRLHCGASDHCEAGTSCQPEVSIEFDDRLEHYRCCCLQLCLNRNRHELALAASIASLMPLAL